MKLALSIEPEGIAELMLAGWLDRRQWRDPAVGGDAVTDLASALLDAGLRPG